MVQKTLIWFNNHFFLLSKYLFIVSKCLIGNKYLFKFRLFIFFSVYTTQNNDIFLNC